MIKLNEINISSIIAQKRKEKQLTQDELAEQMNVSKASVSKWENAQSYPDITLLPKLASFFNISIDELMGYLPQLTKQDIKKKYIKLSNDFVIKPFNEIYQECQELLKEYRACFPLIYQMAILLTNHYQLAVDLKMQESILNEVISLCQNIKNDSGDIWLAKQANSLEAVVNLILQKPLEVIELLPEANRPAQADEIVLASAYRMRGDQQKAKSVLQASMYYHIIELLETGAPYLTLSNLDYLMFEQTLNRFIALAKTFDIENLRPDILVKIYYASALVYVKQNNHNMALTLLNDYAKLCIKDDFITCLHGDKFFDSLEEWFKELNVNREAPRNIKLIREDMLKLITNDIVFEPLRSETLYQEIIKQLEAKWKGEK